MKAMEVDDPFFEMEISLKSFLLPRFLDDPFIPYVFKEYLEKPLRSNTTTTNGKIEDFTLQKKS